LVKKAPLVTLDIREGADWKAMPDHQGHLELAMGPRAQGASKAPMEYPERKDCQALEGKLMGIIN
jgi:hypothetical protein